MERTRPRTRGGNEPPRGAGRTHSTRELLDSLFTAERCLAGLGLGVFVVPWMAQVPLRELLGQMSRDCPEALTSVEPACQSCRTSSPCPTGYRALVPTPLWEWLREWGEQIERQHRLEAADLDDDGHDDLLIGAQYYDLGGIEFGTVYVAQGPVSGTTQLADTGTIITTGDELAMVGARISAGGDTNGDGLPEVTLGSGSYSGYLGGVWIFEPPLSGTITISDADAKFVGEAYGQAGDAVSSGGDVDGDGYGDLLVGAWDYSDMGGRAYLVLGPFEGSNSLGDADAIVEADGFSAKVGEAVSLEQDLDADGRADVVIGAPGASGGPNDGAVFILYDTFEGTVDGFDEAEAVLYTETKENITYTGGRLGPAGDVNGDGFDDLYIHGEVEYLVFGGVR